MFDKSERVCLHNKGGPALLILLRLSLISAHIHKQGQEHLHTHIPRHTENTHIYTHKEMKQRENNTDKNLGGHRKERSLEKRISEGKINVHLSFCSQKDGC